MKLVLNQKSPWIIITLLSISLLGSGCSDSGTNSDLEASGFNNPTSSHSESVELARKLLAKLNENGVFSNSDVTINLTDDLGTISKSDIDNLGKNLPTDESSIQDFCWEIIHQECDSKHTNAIKAMMYELFPNFNRGQLALAKTAPKSTKSGTNNFNGSPIDNDFSLNPQYEIAGLTVVVGSVTVILFIGLWGKSYYDNQSKKKKRSQLAGFMTLQELLIANGTISNTDTAADCQILDETYNHVPLAAKPEYQPKNARDCNQIKQHVDKVIASIEKGKERKFLGGLIYALNGPNQYTIENSISNFDKNKARAAISIK